MSFMNWDKTFPKLSGKVAAMKYPHGASLELSIQDPDCLKI